MYTHTIHYTFKLPKELPAGAMPSVVQVHTEVPPRASREVKRPSRKPDNDRRTQLATSGMELPRLSEDKYDIVRGGSVREVSMR